MTNNGQRTDCLRVFLQAVCQCAVLPVLAAVVEQVLALFLGQTAKHNFGGKSESHPLLPTTKLVNLNEAEAELNDAESVAIVGDKRDALAGRQCDVGGAAKEAGHVGDDGYSPRDLGVDGCADEKVRHSGRNRSVQRRRTRAS